jgi:hypothetical protein
LHGITVDSQTHSELRRRRRGRTERCADGWNTRLEIVSEHKYQNVIREDPREAVGCSVQDYDTRKTMKKNFSSLGSMGTKRIRKSQRQRAWYINIVKGLVGQRVSSWRPYQSTDSGVGR